MSIQLSVRRPAHLRRLRWLEQDVRGKVRTLYLYDTWIGRSSALPCVFPQIEPRGIDPRTYEFGRTDVGRSAIISVPIYRCHYALTWQLPTGEPETTMLTLECVPMQLSFLAKDVFCDISSPSLSISREKDSDGAWDYVGRTRLVHPEIRRRRDLRDFLVSWIILEQLKWRSSLVLAIQSKAVIACLFQELEVLGSRS